MCCILRINLWIELIEVNADIDAIIFGLTDIQLVDF